MSIISSEYEFKTDNYTQNSFIEYLENISASLSSSSGQISQPQFTFIENINTTIGNMKTLTELDDYTEEEASIYEIMKNIKQIDKDKCINNSYIIKELANGCVLFATYNKKIYLYSKDFNFLFETKFPYLVNSIYEVQNNNQNLIKIICCSVFYIYIISFDLNSKEHQCVKESINSDIESEHNLNDIQNEIGRVNNSDKKSVNYIFLLESKNGQHIFCTNNGVYESENILTRERKISKIILLQQYLECISLNDKLICFKSNKQLLNGQDKLTILNLRTKQITSEIDGYSFTLYSDRLILVPLDEKGEKKILIASCTKYSNAQKNGILVVNIDFKSEEKVETKAEFLETEYFSINCICYLDDKKKDNNKKDIYLLAGGVDSEYSKGMVKLYKIYEEEGKTCIEFLQEVLSEENFEGSISCVYQLKNGKIIISAGNGNILFSSPNLVGYKEDNF
jgi:hypothetical protein